MITNRFAILLPLVELDGIAIAVLIKHHKALWRFMMFTLLAAKRPSLCNTIEKLKIYFKRFILINEFIGNIG